MKNKAFYELLHAERDSHHRPVWTVERVAEAIYSERSHVTRVLSNSPKRGYQTRWKLAQFFRKQFAKWEEMLRALDWKGELERIKASEAARKLEEDSNVSLATFHVETDD